MNAALPIAAVSRCVRPRAATRRAGIAFVAACPEATFFHRFAWREIYESVFKHRTHYLLAERADEVVGVLPLVELRSLLFGHSLCSLPFAVYGGVAATDPAAVVALHEAAVALGRELGVQHLELRNRVHASPRGRGRICT